MFERPLYEGNLWARAQSGRVSCSELYKDSLLAPIRDEAALTGRLCSKSHVAKLCHENGFHSRRKTLLAPAPALGSTGRLTLDLCRKCPGSEILIMSERHSPGHFR